VTIIVDTNVLLAGLAAKNEHSPPRRILVALRDGSHNALVSPALVAEYRDVLNRPEVVRWHGLQPPLPDRVVDELVRFSSAIEPEVTVIAAPDPGDQFVWALLAADPAAVLVTGDKALMESDAFPGRILSPRAFVDAHLVPPSP
jgi:putative PIN family toxin of toxin-antitoxin system